MGNRESLKAPLSGAASTQPGEAGPGVVLIAALDRNRAIGKGNAMPWHLPDDLKRFKALTLGKPVLMGRRTAESLGRALPGRLNLVLTRSGRVPFAGMQAVSSIDEALRIASAQGASDLCVIGGGEVYALALPLVALGLFLLWKSRSSPTLQPAVAGGQA